MVKIRDRPNPACWYAQGRLTTAVPIIEFQQLKMTTTDPCFPSTINKIHVKKKKFLPYLANGFYRMP